MRSRLITTAVLAGAAIAVPAGAAPADAQAAWEGPKVEVMVVGKGDDTLAYGKRVTARTTRVRAGDRRCRVKHGTALAALAARDRAGGPSFSVKDFARCSSRRTIDSGALFVQRIGSDRNRGEDGWVYKVDRRAGTASSGAPSGAFGNGRLHSDQRVLWFWCEMTRSGGCQRTLDVTPSRRTVAPGAHVTVTVRGYDNEGRGVRVAGAAVRLGRDTAVTGRDGRATLTAPAKAGSVKLYARHEGMVRSFTERVRVR